jgi:hypothetical protein
MIEAGSRGVDLHRPSGTYPAATERRESDLVAVGLAVEAAARTGECLAERLITRSSSEQRPDAAAATERGVDN